MASPRVFGFDSTLKGVDSTSYVDLYTTFVNDPSDGIDYPAFGANDFFSVHLDGDIWSSLTDAKKQALLVMATNRLEREPWGGKQTSQTQALQWPRTCIVDRRFYNDYQPFDYNNGSYYYTSCVDGVYYLSSEVVPREIAFATFELAIYYYKERVLETPTISRQDQERLETLQVGPISLKPRKVSEDRLPSDVINYLQVCSPNAWLGNKQPRLVRG